uniref:Uncharacterized protein n=1 Tax=Palpitomonas bilix TaxID=652834 RepID=A0A7S3DCP1_9EUKA|mmetsp:Transcript_31845/g.83125  ORF Transcript_31845/g.83125 Transcript_31845/m.83125 type:complete len:230 (+) Transcript_31845:335-1024(+)
MSAANSGNAGVNPLAALLGGGSTDSLSKEEQSALLSQLLSTFGNSIVVDEGGEGSNGGEKEGGEEGEVKVSKCDSAEDGDLNADPIFCPHCKCKLLRPKTATFRRVELDVPSTSGRVSNEGGKNGKVVEFPSERISSFYTVKNVMAFDNVSACRNVEGDRAKFFGCPDCDLGPLALTILKRGGVAKVEEVKSNEGSKEGEKEDADEEERLNALADGTIYICADRVVYEK